MQRTSLSTAIHRAAIAIVALASLTGAHAAPPRTVIIGFIGLSNNVAPGLGVFTENAGTANDARICEIGRAPWHTDRALVCPATEPLDNVGHGQGHGAGLELLRYFARKPGNLSIGDTLIAVPGAAGGTNILQWNGTEQYNLPPAQSGPVFDLNGDFMSRVDLAMGQSNPSIAFVMAAVSEEDIEKIALQNDPNMASPQDYVNAFQALVSTWRAKYGMFPVIFVPHSAGWIVKQPQWATAANAVMAAVSNMALPCFAIIDTHDLKDNSDVTGDPQTANHYSAESFEHVANRAVYNALPSALANNCTAATLH